MEHYKILVSESYQRDLRNIIRYISHNLDAPYTAAELLDDIEKIVGSLSAMPLRFAVVEDAYLFVKAFRKCPVRNYLVFYQVDEEHKRVLVHRIVHARQDWLTML